MAKTRRRFLRDSSLGVLGAALAGTANAQVPQSSPTPGMPPAFGTAPAAGPEVSADTLREAEKLVEVELSAKDVAEAAGNWRQSMAPLYESRVGPPRNVLMCSWIALFT